MAQLRFNKRGFLVPRGISYDAEHNERYRELIDKYIRDECNFRVKYNDKGDSRFIRRKIRKEIDLLKKTNEKSGINNE